MDESAAEAEPEAEVLTTSSAEGTGKAKKAGGAVRKQRPLWKELPLLVLVALVLALIIKTFFVQAFSIPSDSMQNTLQKGDRVLVDKFTPWFGATPERGDVVVFKDPGGWLQGEDLPTASTNPVVRDIQSVLSDIGLVPSVDDHDLIKRVIAVGGDTVTCKADMPVEVNGIALNEPYIYPGATPCNNYPVGTVKVPKGYLWVMGDNRGNSADSRYNRLYNPGSTGFVPVKNVVGRAFVVAWPISHWAVLSVPSTFNQHGLASAAPAAVPGAVDGLALALPATALWYRRRRR